MCGVCVCGVPPEEEDMEWQSDWKAFPPDPDRLQDTRIMQLTADQVQLKHAWLLHTHTHTQRIAV